MGELRSDMGTAAWIIEDADTQDCCRGVCLTSGTRTEVNPYRSELQGLYRLIGFITALCQYHRVTLKSIIVGCDCSNAIKRSAHESLRVKQQVKHSDLIWAIRALIAEVPVDIDLRHVKGHLDSMVKFVDLPRLNQLNVHVDKLAKWYLRWLVDHGAGPLDSLSTPDAGWEVWIDGRKATGDISEQVKCATTGLDLLAHFETKKWLSTEAFQVIDWDALENVTPSHPALNQLWASKRHASGQFSCGKMMKHWGFWEANKCPCCRATDEDKFHLLQCPDERCVEKWKSSVSNLQLWFHPRDTSQEMSVWFISILRTRRADARFTAPTGSLLVAAILDQDLIGWTNLTEGKISKHR